MKQQRFLVNDKYLERLLIPRIYIFSTQTIKMHSNFKIYDAIVSFDYLISKSGLCFEICFCNAGIKNRMIPLNAIHAPLHKKPGVYELERS